MRYKRIVILKAAFLFIGASLSFASALTVKPVKLVLPAGKRTEVLRVANEGDDKVTVQVEAMKWAQGEGGKDVYEATEDIVFFPKIFTVEKGKEVVLRIGLKERKATDKELSYRVFLQEIPIAKPGESQVRLALRLSIPLFIQPAKEVKDWAIEKAELSGDMLLLEIKNGGNSHMTVGKIRAKGLDVSGQVIFQQEGSGWYVLPGVTRAFSLKLPGQECQKSSAIMISVEGGESKKETKISLDKALRAGDQE